MAEHEKMEVSGRKQQNIDALKVIMDQDDVYIKNYYMGPLTETMQSKNELINEGLRQSENRGWVCLSCSKIEKYYFP